MNLFFASVNKEYSITQNNIQNFRIKLRLMDMGMHIGAKVKVLDRKRRKNNALVALNGVKYMINVELLKQIEVLDA